MAGGVLGHGAMPFRVTFFDNSPDSNWLVAWPQDTALPLVDRREAPGWGPWAHSPAAALQQVLALRVHPDHLTAAHGPLRVLFCTHERRVLTDEEIRQRAGESQRIARTVAAGGVVRMRPLLLHASSKSLSDQPRRVVHIEYAAALGIGDGLELAVV